MKIIKSIYKFFTKTRLRRILSSILAVLILLTSIRYLFLLNPKEAKASIVEVKASNDTTLSQTSYTVVDGMQITPKAGTYLAVFSMEILIDASAGNNILLTSLFVNGVQQTHTERQFDSDSSLTNAVYTVTTHSYITVGTGQQVDVRYNIDTTPAFIGRERALTLMPVDSADVTQVTATTNDTTSSATYVQLGSMTATPGAGDYLLVFSSSAFGPNDGAPLEIMDFAVFVNGSIVQHTNRTITNEGSSMVNATPVMIAAKVSPGAGQTVEVQWRNPGNAGTITALERTMTLVKLGPDELFEASATADSTISASHTTDQRIDSMVLTPGAGNYLAMFSSSDFYGTVPGGSNATTFYSFRSNGSQVSGTEREFMHEESIDDSDIAVFAAGKLNVGSNQNVEVYWRGDQANNRTIHERTFILIREPQPVVNIGMNEGYGSAVNDTNENVSSGTRTNAVWQNEDLCKFGKCLYFDGTGDYVSFADDTNFDMGTGSTVTIEGWFRTPDITSGTRTIIAKEESTGADGGYRIEMNSSGQIVLGIDNDNSTFPSDSVTSTSAYDDNQWHHFAAVKNASSSLTLYIDAISVGTPDASPAADISNDDIFYIGIYNGSSNGFSGFIDEVKIYRTARTQADINADFTGASSGRGVSASFDGADQSYLSQGLVGYWKLDESSTGAGAVTRNDSSGNGNNLTDNNTVASATGKFAQGADFENNPTDNNENLSITDASQKGLDITGSMTISAWVKPETVSVTQAIAGKDGDPASNNEGYYIRVSSGNQFQFLIAAPSDGTTMTSVNATTTSVAAGTWYHVVGVYDGAKIYIYVNGTLEGTATPAEQGIRDSTEAFRIGIVRASSLEYDGLIDSVRVYNRALSNKEVLSLYKWAPGPIGYWNFNENTGNTANDLSGNANNASLSNTIWTQGKYGGGLGGNINGSPTTATVTDPSSGIFDFSNTQDFTFEIWIKINQNEDYVVPIHKGATVESSVGYDLEFGQFDGSQNCRYTDGDGVGVDQASSGLTLYDGKWHHIACVMDRGGGDTAKDGFYIYIDGSLQASDTSLTEGSAASNTTDLSFAETFDTYEYNGGFDEARIYNYARTSRQVVEDMNGGHPSPGSPVGSPVGYWKFDDGSGDTANNGGTGGSAYNGNLAGSGTTCPQSVDSACPTWTNSGKFGKALDFETTGTTDDIVDLGDINELDGTDQFTISVWANFETLQNNYDTIFSKRASSGNKIVLSTGATGDGGGSDDPYLSIENDVANTFGYTTDNLLSAGVWGHWVVVYNGAGSSNSDKLKFYFNGFQKSLSFSGTLPTTTDSNATTAQLGVEQTLSTYFDGQLDEMKIYNFAMTSDQVLVEYNKGSQTVMGATSTDSSGNATWSALNEFCPPGQGSGCTPPILYIPFDENTGTTSVNDISTNNFTGTMNGSIPATAWQPGKLGASLTFDGSNDNVSVTDNNTLDITGDFTISAWFARTGAGNEVVVAKNQNATSGGYSLLVGGSGEVYCRTNNLSANADSFTATGLVNADDVWHHLLIVRSGTSCRVWVDGIDRTSTAATHTTLSANALNLTIGDEPDASDPAGGRIDDVRIYNYARNQTQIMWDYNRGKAKGRWKMDETAANTCAGGSNDSCDSAGNGYDLAWSGDATFTTGRFNNATTYDGTGDYAACTDANCGGTTNLDLMTTPKASWGGWIKRTSSGVQTIAGKKNTTASTDAGYYIGTDASNLIECRLSDGTNAQSVSGLTSVNDGGWHLVYCVDDGTSLYVFVDARNEANKTVGSVTGTIDNTSDFRVGSNGAGTSLFTGQIDDVRLFRYGLTAKQMELLYNEGATARFGPPTGTP